MSNYKGAMYIGTDPIHLFDGNIIVNGEVTNLLSEEAAINDNNFEPVYNEKNVKKQENDTFSFQRKSKKRGNK